MKIRAGVLIVLVWLCVAGAGVTAVQAQDSSTGPQPRNADYAKTLYEARLARYKASPSPDVLVLPGLVANRKTKQVELLAESTGLGGNSTAEFLLIDQASGHGYEALFWSYAKPSDVHAALLFVGMQPGAPYDPGQLRFWPKGERVNVSIVDTNRSVGTSPLRIENLILDKKTEKPLAESGLIFTGSIRAPDPKGGTGIVYVADNYDPKSIASLYNEPGTVLDVPWQADKGAVYGAQVVNPEYVYSAGDLMTLILEPERKDGSSRVKNLVMEVGFGAVRPGPGDPAVKLVEAGRSFTFRVKDTKGNVLGKDVSLEGALAAISELLKTGSEPYLSVCFDGTLTLSDVRRTCVILGVIEAGAGLRFEPPQEGQLYFKAFVPDERWRDADTRIAQPWELHLVREKGIVSGKLVMTEAIWADGNPDPKMKVTSFDVASPKALREQLDADAERRKQGNRSPDLPVLLIFAKGDLTYGELMRFITPALRTHNTVHVFLAQK